MEFDLADRLRKALRVGGIGVGDMATVLGMERNTVSRYINGHTQPSRPTVMVWAMECGVPLEWLVTGQMPEVELVGAAGHDEGPGSEDAEAAVRHRGLEPRTRWFTNPSVGLEGTHNQRFTTRLDDVRRSPMLLCCAQHAGLDRDDFDGAFWGIVGEIEVTA